VFNVEVQAFFQSRVAREVVAILEEECHLVLVRVHWVCVETLVRITRRVVSGGCSTADSRCGCCDGYVDPHICILGGQSKREVHSNTNQSAIVHSLYSPAHLLRATRAPMECRGSLRTSLCLGESTTAGPCPPIELQSTHLRYHHRSARSMS
jgi:hypothetical protein